MIIYYYYSFVLYIIHMHVFIIVIYIIIFEMLRDIDNNWIISVIYTVIIIISVKFLHL